ncbi:hypothetical protein [Celeribacter halophilus]|uniref:hypothetical protein n=1 Tax=Celeribacter halophilus TaxID=576117 RepID=UPI003A94BA8C
MNYSNLLKDDTLGCSLCDVELREFFSENSEALGCAAALIAGRRGARLVDAIREGLCQPGPLTRRMECLLLNLRGILFLDDIHRNPDGEFGYLTRLEPEDPAVAEICLLADGLDDALRAADIIPNLGESAA